MKTAIAALLALGLIAGQASARTVFDDLGASAPRAEIFADINTSAPRSAFDDLRNSAPRSGFDSLRDSAPRSDGIYGTLETGAP